MANGDEKNKDFYGDLGLNKECTPSELRIAYKKLAMRWHPDRFSASGSSKFVEEAKKKFQTIQQAYSVLSDENKRLMYDIGAYDSDDDDENGMGDFLNDMVTMMNETKPNENDGETFEDLQRLFEDMFQGENETSNYSSFYETSTSSSSYTSGSSNRDSKRNSSEMNDRDTSSHFSTHFQGFSVGTGGTSTGYGGDEGSKRKTSRRNKR